MAKKKHDDLVRQHALNRLNKVQKEQRRAYKKDDASFNFQNIFMAVILTIMLAIMIYSIF